MLQQTQVSRVVPKYDQWLWRFSCVDNLAQASLADVLSAWSGLGYNRRAKYLHEAAKTLASLSEPWTYEALVACKGIGSNTAAAVMVYAYNQPLVFIETNIRTVYIHHFFNDRDTIPDSEILSLVAQTLDHENPREFYWALMDYGVHLKATVGNASRSSAHYAKQSTFAGSRRQIRGQVLKRLMTQPQTQAELAVIISDERLDTVVADLLREGMITGRNGQLALG